MRINLAVFFIMISTFQLAYARINVLELWHPGQDTTVLTLNKYTVHAGMKTGEHFIELPVFFSYGSTDRLEVGGRWGIISHDQTTGISDMLIGLKYQLLKGEKDHPSVIGETAVSLPTADYNNGLGTGSVDIMVHWALEQKVERIMASFGLGLLLPSKNPDDIRPGDVFFYHIGGSLPYQPFQKVHLELKGLNHADTEIAGTRQRQSGYQELYLAPGITYVWQKQTTVSCALLIGLTPESHGLGFLISGNF